MAEDQKFDDVDLIQKPNQEEISLNVYADRINEKYVELYAQTISQRKYAMWIAVIVITFLLTLAALMLFCDHEVIPDKDLMHLPLIIIAPIISAATITIAILIGVFKGFRNKEINDAGDLSGKVIRFTNVS